MGGFRELTNLSTFDLFGFGGGRHPHPGTDVGASLVLDDQPAGDGGKSGKATLEKKAGNGPADHQTRKPEWLAQNLDNPFRGWDGAEHIPAAAAKMAANQYRKTRSQLMKLAAEPGEDAQAQALDAVTAYTQTFNKMGFIETEERDEIYMALRGILDALPGDTLQKDALIEKFDELRDFLRRTSSMIEFSKDHSSAWMEMMSAYQVFRAKLFDWAHEPDRKKQKDLLLELDSWENRDIHRRMLVVNLLRSTEMWDEKALLLVLKELTAIALQEQDEIAAYARMALSKIKDQSERLTIADEVLRLAAVEGEKPEPDPVIFHNGCLLLFNLHCEAEFSQYVDRYANLIRSGIRFR